MLPPCCCSLSERGGADSAGVVTVQRIRLRGRENGVPASHDAVDGLAGLHRALCVVLGRSRIDDGPSGPGERGPDWDWKRVYLLLTSASLLPIGERPLYRGASSRVSVGFWAVSVLFSSVSGFVMYRLSRSSVSLAPVVFILCRVTRFFRGVSISKLSAPLKYRA